MKVLALIFDGFEEEEAMAPFAILRRAGIDLTIASLGKTAVGSHDITLTNLKKIVKIPYKQYDALLIPGGAHYKYLKVSGLVHEIIRHFFDSDKYVFGICAAPTIFGMLGYLKGKKYTCFKAMDEDFGGTFEKIGVVTDGKLITATSVAYSLDFAYEIVRVLLGDEALNELHKHIYYEK